MLGRKDLPVSQHLMAYIDNAQASAAAARIPGEMTTTARNNRMDS